MVKYTLHIMKYNLLFPRRFKLVGGILSVLSAVLGSINLYGDYLLPHIGDYSDETASIGLILGLLFLGFSKQKVEDEMIERLRLQSLQLSLYVNYMLLIFAIIVFYDFQFLHVLLYNMFTILIVFNFRFFWLLRKSSLDIEE